jgi:type IV pilus assembly protein PilV
MAGHGIRPTRIQSGFTMVESLVALVIIVIGIVGSIAVQSAGIGGTKVAADRSVAAIHTAALISRMKGNDAYWQNIPDDFDVEVAADGTITDLGGGSDGADLAGEGADCSAVSCTALQAAAYGLKTWAQNGSSAGAHGGFADRLSAPAARIRRVGNDFPVMVEITLTWNERRATSGMQMAGTYYSASGTAANSERAFNYVMLARP